MFTLLLISTFYGSTIAENNITVSDLKDDVTGSWSLTLFSEMIRRVIISSVPFPWETVETALDTDSEIDISHLALEMITHELPLLIPACLGLLLAILVPIFTLIFCCCRCCCGCCGGKLTAQNVKKHKLHFMYINSFTVLFLVGCISAMACCIPIGGNRLQTSPRLMLRAVNTSLDDISFFFERFVNDTSGFTMDVLNTTVAGIKKDLDNLPDTLSEPVTDGARPIVDEIESKMYIISSEIIFLEEAEGEINSTVDAMIVYSNNLQTGLDNINGLYITIKTDCTNAGKSFCGSLPDGSGADAFNVSIDNSKLTDIANEATALLTEAKKVNLTEYSTLGNTTFEEVPKTIKNASQTAIDTVKSTLDTVHDDMKPEIDSAVESAKFDLDLGDTLDPLDKSISQVENYKSTINIALAVLGGILFTIGIVAFVGMMLGILCTKKSSTISMTGRTKAGSCGACLLMTSVGLAVFPLLLILLLGSTLMLLGGNVTIVCAPLQDLTVFRRLVDSGLLFGGDNLGEMFFNDSSLNLSITNLFKTCQDDGTVFSGLNLASVMNLSTLFNADEFVPELGDSVVTQINDTIKDISIVNTSSFDDLKSKLDLPNMDTNTGQEIEGELNDIDLEEKSKEINDLADSIPDPDFADRYKAISIGLQELHDNSKVPLLQSINNLSTLLDKLNSTSQAMKVNLFRATKLYFVKYAKYRMASLQNWLSRRKQVVITDLSDDLDNLTSYVEDNAANVVLKALNDFLDGMSTVPDTLIGSVTDALSTDIGRCRVLSDVYEIVIGSFCTHFLDSFNVLWASFYTSGLLCVVLMISNCTLSKYFRRPDDLDYTQQMRNRTNNAYPSPSSANVDLIYYKTNTDHRNASNNASFNKVNYQRLHQKWRHRRRLITGPFTAQFFADNMKGKSSEQTNLPIDIKQDINSNRPLCTVVDFDDLTNGSAWCSQSLQSFQETSSKDTLNSNDEDGRKTDSCEKICGIIVNKEESVFSSSNDLNFPIRKSVENAKAEVKVKDGRQRASEITAFPYFQLEDDEFILLPMTNLTAESLEDVDQKNGAIEDDKQQHSAIHQLEHKICKGNEKSGMDRWLNSYKIESNSEQNTSSPLVTYSSENGTHMSKRFEIKKCHDINTVSQETLSSYGYKELDHDQNMKRCHGMNVSDNNERHKSHDDGSNYSVGASKSLLRSKKRDSIDETEYPVQDVICALCEIVGVKNRKLGNSGTKAVNIPNLKSFGEEQNEIHQKDSNTNDASKTIDNCISNFGIEDEIAQLNKSLENSFKTFDHTLENLTCDSICDQKEGQIDVKSKLMDTKNRNVYRHKLDLKVKPYKPLTKMLSPHAAFHFWKYIEANCSCKNDSNSLLRREECNNVDKHVPADKETDAMYDCENLLSENVELLSKINQYEATEDICLNGPESLVNLAIKASTLAYIPKEKELMDTRRNNQNIFKDGQKQVPRYEVASTRKGNVQVSYV